MCVEKIAVRQLDNNSSFRVAGAEASMATMWNRRFRG
jgi:hypothetical protein